MYSTYIVCQSVAMVLPCISSPGLTRESQSGLTRFISLDGMATLRRCLAAEEAKLTIKTLFMLSSYYSMSEGEVKGQCC